MGVLAALTPGRVADASVIVRDPANAAYRDITRNVEIPSINESVLDSQTCVSAFSFPFAQDLRSTVADLADIPTYVTLAPTKTLAKLADHTARTMPILNSV